MSLKKLINSFPELNWCGSGYEIYHNHQLVLPMRVPQMKHQAWWKGAIDDFFASSYQDCLAWTSSVCFKRSFFLELGGFNKEYTTGQDIDLWIRAALKSKFHFVNHITTRYNLQGSNRLTNMPTVDKKYMNPNSFSDEEKVNASLNKYLDLIRYSFSIKHKAAGDYKSAMNYRSNIKLSNLTMAQQFLLHQCRYVLLVLGCVKYFLEFFRIKDKDI